MTRKDVKGVIESLAKIGYKELKKNGSLLCARIRQIRCHQEARHKERHQSVHKGATIFEAKPARKIIRARPGKACQRRSIVAAKTSMGYDARRGATDPRFRRRSDPRVRS
jgi:DNA-binding protein HU-beta